MKFTGKNDQYFELETLNGDNADLIYESRVTQLSLIWFKSDGNELILDGRTFNFGKDDILCLTDFHKIEIKNLNEAKILRWNKPFYCIVTNDSEVGCRGILFYGATEIPVVKPNEADLDVFSTVWHMLELEMASKDDLQEEMLQMMLKRIIILCTRMYKEQSELKNLDKEKTDLVRDYHFLVEQNFKKLSAVAEFADLMNKSPKTLSNAFKKLGRKSPLQFIKDRKMLEARRLLTYTDKSISEVGYDIGFPDVQSFSRFFKKGAGDSPQNFRKNPISGKIANS